MHFDMILESMVKYNIMVLIGVSHLGPFMGPCLVYYKDSRVGDHSKGLWLEF